MRYIGIEVTPEQHAGLCERYYMDLFNDRQFDFAFPRRDIVVIADAIEMIYSYEVRIFLVFAWPESPWEMFKIKQLTGRGYAQPLAACHLTDFTGLTANAHFSIHPDVVPRKDDIVTLGKDFLSWLFKLKRADEPDTPFVETIIGLTPRYNIGAVGLAKKLGFTVRCVIKNGMYSRVKNRYCDVVFSTLHRREYE